MQPPATSRIPMGMAAALHAVGVSYTEVLARARLPAHHLDVPGERVSVPEYFALWDAIQVTSRDPGVGIRLAEAVQPDCLEPLFLALLSCASVSEAFRVLCTYKRMLSPEIIEVHQAGAGQPVRLSYRWPEVHREPPQALVDAELAFLTLVCRQATRTPELAPREVCLRARSVEPAAGHAAFFRCPIRLGAQRTALVLDAEDAARPFVTHNPRMLDALVPYLQANTPPASEGPLTSVVRRVRQLLPGRIRGQRATVRSLAKDLGMSARALQRALQEEGTSFRQVLDEVRNEHARRYLAQGAFSDTEIAFLLGFEEVNSFYRAFRSWNGAAPGAFRG